MDDAIGVWKKACNFGKRRGLGDESEDFASWLIEKKLSGLRKHQTIEQSFIDYSNEMRTNKRILGSPEGYSSKHIRTSIDKPIGNENDNGSTVGDFIGVPGDDMELRSEFRSTTELISEVIGLVRDKRTREEIKRIYFEWLTQSM